MANGKGTDHDKEDGAHGAIRDLLPAYATSQVWEMGPQEDFAEVAAHLATCVACRYEVDELVDWMQASLSGEIERPATDSTPNLALLRGSPSPTTPPRDWFVDVLGRVVVRFSQALLDSLKHQSLGGAMRGEAEYTYSLEDESLPGLGVEIHIEKEASGNSARVTVKVHEQEGDPLAQGISLVALTAPGMKNKSAKTDELGHVSFKLIPLDILPSLQVAIEPL